MQRFQSATAVFCAALTIAPLAPAQDRTPVLQDPHGFLRTYEPTVAPPLDLSNSSRLDALMRAGNIYLSLQDAIALALENNLDIARERYGTLIAETDLKRARAGGALRGVNQTVANGAQSATGGLSLNALSSGNTGNGSNALTSSGSSTGGVNGIISQLGPTVPNLDPVLTGQIFAGHFTSIQTSAFIFGTNALVQQNNGYNFGIQQGFLSGAQAQIFYGSNFINQNSARPDLNPYTTASMEVVVTQPLLQGFGFAVNNREIRIAKNNINISSLVFKQQVINTVANVAGLYWDLVAFQENVKVAEQALKVSQKLYEDNKKQVEVGTLAPIEIVRAEAEVAARQQDLTVAQTNVLQQETILKNALSRTGVANPMIAAAHIVPTDRIRIDATEPVQPIQDLEQLALTSRPEIFQSRINLQNTKITLHGDRNALLPRLDAFADLTNQGQVGIVNPLPPLQGQGQGFRSVDPTFVGGYGSLLGQVFGHNFPNYRVGLQLSIPLRNRAAQADYARDQLTLRQNEIDLQKQANQIRVDVQNAIVAQQQARARYDAAVKQRVLEEQTLDAEQKKYALGASTIFQVIQTQRDLATAQFSEVQAEEQYIRARLNVHLATGQILSTYNVDIDEARKGQVSRAPAALPVDLGPGASLNKSATPPPSSYAAQPGQLAR